MLKEEEPGRRSRRSAVGPLAFGPPITFRICVGGGWMMLLLVLLLLLAALFEPDDGPAPEPDTEDAVPARVEGAVADGPLDALVSVGLRAPAAAVDLLAPAEPLS